MSKALIAVTMGDPAGVGPEIIVRSWNSPHLAPLPRVVVGSPGVIQRAIDLVSANLMVRVLSGIDDSFDSRREIGVFPIPTPERHLTARGRVDRACGQAAYEAVEIATHLAIDRRIDAIVTAPLNKLALHLAGHVVPGHTELLAHWCGVDKFAMMLYLPPDTNIAGELGLGVVHTTLHMALRDVFAKLTSASIFETCELATGFVRSLLQARGKTRAERVAVAALNPHGGEGGLFGDEEQRVIAPAVAQGQSRGWHLTGPLPTDTLMQRAVAGEFDAVVAMYHDQGHIALKLLGMSRAVNVTLGLPIIRTSVAHGTAFDIAWQGRADASSLIVACRLAAELAQSHSQKREL